MFFKNARLILLVLLAVLWGVGAANDRMVVVISIDGFPAYALDDARLPVPTLRKLAAEGVLARRMVNVNPTVTWPNHTTMVTGVAPARHGVLFNGMLLRQGPASLPRIEPWRDKAEMVRAPTVYDLARQAGLTTAQVDWVAVQNAGFTWEFPERPNSEGREEREMVAAGLVAGKDIAEFQKSTPPWRDQVWTRAAVHIIEAHKPNLLLFHLLNLDSVHHQYGPKTLASANGIALADARVREVLDAIDHAGMRERATVLVVSDHGFKAVTRAIRPNAALRANGLLRAPGGPGSKIECDAFAVIEGGTAMLYVTNPGNRARLVPELKRIFASVEGIARVIGPEEYPSLGLPDPQEYDQAPDLLLAAKEGYTFAAGQDGETVAEIPRGGSLGTHGYLNSDPDMNAIFLAWGYGIDRSARLDTISILDVAPTIAALLGLKMENVAGKALPIVK